MARDRGTFIVIIRLGTTTTSLLATAAVARSRDLRLFEVKIHEKGNHPKRVY